MIPHQSQRPCRPPGATGPPEGPSNRGSRLELARDAERRCRHVGSRRHAGSWLTPWADRCPASVFGLSIALIACQRGLAARGGAAGGGRATASAVVGSRVAMVVV